MATDSHSMENDLLQTDFLNFLKSCLTEPTCAIIYGGQPKSGFGACLLVYCINLFEAPKFSMFVSMYGREVTEP